MPNLCGWGWVQCLVAQVSVVELFIVGNICSFKCFIQFDYVRVWGATQHPLLTRQIRYDIGGHIAPQPGAHRFDMSVCCSMALDHANATTAVRIGRLVLTERVHGRPTPGADRRD